MFSIENWFDDDEVIFQDMNAFYSTETFMVGIYLKRFHEKSPSIKDLTAA